MSNKLEVKRVKFLNIEDDAGDSQTELCEEEQFEADFTLMTGELAQMLAELTDALGGEPQRLAAAA